MPQLGNTRVSWDVEYMFLLICDFEIKQILNGIVLHHFLPFPISIFSLKPFDTRRLPELPFFIESSIPNVSCFDKILYEYRYIGAYACIYAHIHMF